MEQSPPEIWRLFLKGKPMLNQNPNWQRLWIVNFEEQIIPEIEAGAKGESIPKQYLKGYE